MTPTLNIGDRVSDKQRRHGVITFRKLVAGKRWAYMVRWNGNRHESGEYGPGSLRRIRGTDQ